MSRERFYKQNTYFKDESNYSEIPNSLSPNKEYYERMYGSGDG